MWAGKLIGGLLGYWLGGLFGALLGVLLGHLIDRGLAVSRFVLGDLGRIHEIFFRSTFGIMGHVCKIDGRVSEAEIAAAESIMAQMNLSAEQRRAAIGYFNAGKRADFDLDRALSEFRRVGRGQINLLRMFLEIQIQAALADGRIDEAERSALLYIARGLGLQESECARLEAFLAGSYQRAQANPPGARGDRLADAYRTLGVSPSNSASEVKKAYRRLMNQHHPDKLVARGLPEAMIKIAQQRTQAIRAAYDSIKRARAMK
ncbi:MAG: co-chaperone DjlA [Nitrococcus mobilis]|nr:co-chaperone DjlA [Nitrococcus mobilis]